MYLLIDVIIVVGFLLRRMAGYVAFYVAAVSQIVLYTVLRAWIVDVPAEFAVSEEQQAYLTGLVVFHCVTMVLVSLALIIERQTSGQDIP